MTDMRFRISIIVPFYNAAPYLPEALGAVRDSGFSDYELIAVDDKSADESLEIARRFADKIAETGVNSGPGAARNLGVTESSGEVLFFLDADVRLHPDTLEKVDHALRRNPDIAAIFGSYDAHPPHKNFFSQYKNLSHHYIHQNSKMESRTFWAGCGAIRREEFLAVGGFSKRYGTASIEDVELGYKLNEQRKRIRLDKNIQVTHLKKWTFFDLVKTDIVNRAFPWSELAVRRGLPYDLNFKLSDRMSAAAVFVFLGSAILTFFWNPGIIFLLGCMALLLFLNRRFYVFFLKKNGIWFALRTVLFHWFYFLYSSVTYALCTVFFRLRKLA